MSFNYFVSSGIMSSPEGTSWVGYSGHGEGLNNPAMQDIKGVGPIPKGTYTIGEAFHHPTKGPCVMRLTPHPDNEMFGRDGFLLHGDNFALNHTASDGCIIQGLDARTSISASTDKTLVVL